MGFILYIGIIVYVVFIYGYLLYLLYINVLRKECMCFYLYVYIEMIVELFFLYFDGWGYMNIINFCVFEILV